MTQLPVELVHLYPPARGRHILVQRRLNRYAPSFLVLSHGRVLSYGRVLGDGRVLGSEGNRLPGSTFARHDTKIPHPLVVRVMAAVIVLQAGVITVLVVVD